VDPAAPRRATLSRIAATIRRALSLSSLRSAPSGVAVGVRAASMARKSSWMASQSA
jgi:hypothetical protein